MLIRLILDPANELRSGANQMRQWLSFREHSRRGNAALHPDRRAADLAHRITKSAKTAKFWGSPAYATMPRPYAKLDPVAEL
jgi:hypothetical protein